MVDDCVRQINRLTKIDRMREGCTKKKKTEGERMRERVRERVRGRDKEKNREREKRKDRELWDMG